jgi:hypothetical protein
VSRHLCHATDCQREVPPAKFMCPKHWHALPDRMQRAVWGAYVPGQEIRKDPSAQYLRVTREAIGYLEEIEGRQGQFPVFA